MSPDLVEKVLPILESADEATWFSAIERLAHSLGFEQILLGILPRPGLLWEDAFIRTTFPESWRRLYQEQKLADIDPTLIHCLTHSVPIIWSSEIFTTSAQHSMYELAYGHGLRAGVALPIHGPRQESGMLCFASDSDLNAEILRHINALLPDLVLVRDMVAETSVRHTNSCATGHVPTLTPRERECLQWTMRGKTSWEISRILSCSVAAVNFHMKNIREKFGVPTRRAAVVMAIRLGIVDPA
ncbi:MULTISPECIES: LuxR family transcriptional regulator [unclassified Burkholderia]|uniref:helix-turn-helix transcriptional regulator n=1 Tax=unclassified Burkholderia TaxID=2613784 RepID=UPI0009EB6B2E|nr:MULTISPECIES: LuxR family transcriptional regulator [unclassified Burkholderia]